MDEIEKKIADIIDTYWAVAEGVELEEAVTKLQSALNEMYKSLGACDRCWGAGYTGVDKELNFCECDRGKKLVKLYLLNNWDGANRD